MEQHDEGVLRGADFHAAASEQSPRIARRVKEFHNSLQRNQC